MSRKSELLKGEETKNFSEFSQLADFSLMNSLNADPDSKKDGNDHRARSVYSGHYVPVTPTPIPEPIYVSHSKTLFKELGLSSDLTKDKNFCRFFSGDIEVAEYPMRPFGWATGYALSIYGTEYTQQCPFGTGNGYGDGRAISVFEGIFNGKRMEMQLKGGGPTPYCRGADGRAVLRSSVREFLAQELMHALGIPTSRSLTLYVSGTEIVRRPWYTEGSRYFEPDIMVNNHAAITTRVAPSFLRVGQLELFARRVRSNSHDDAFNELKIIVQHLIDRNYRDDIDPSHSFNEKVIRLANLYRGRLISLVTNWMRVGYCQGNFNSDNCAAGGFTLDYGPFGFCELFDPQFQPWTGGGGHFAFLNQPVAAEANFHMFWKSLRLLILDHDKNLEELDQIRKDFESHMQAKLQDMWAKKLGLAQYDRQLCDGLLQLLELSKVDFTIFFRELSHLPTDFSALNKSFYTPLPQQLEVQWQSWFDQWSRLIASANNQQAISQNMLKINPKYTWREWLIVPAYEQASRGDYSLIHQIQAILNQPYEEQTQAIEDQYYRLRPDSFFYAGGVSHYSCSS